jgi:hypothetical protein
MDFPGEMNKYEQMIMIFHGGFSIYDL